MEKVKYRIKEKVGLHYDGGKPYGPGDFIMLYPHNAEKILDKLIRVDPVVEPSEPEPVVTMIIVETENDLFDVVNEVTSERINDEPLTLEQATSLVGTEVPIQRIAVDPGPIKAVHKGDGKYAIVWDETEQEVVAQDFTRAEAAAVIKSIDEGTMTIEGLVAEWS